MLERKNYRSVAVLGMLLVLACLGATGCNAPQTGTEKSAQSDLTAVATRTVSAAESTVLPTPTVPATKSVASATPVVAPTESPVQATQTPLAAQSTPQSTYTSPHFQVSLEHPSDWKPVPGYGSPEGGEKYAGEDGFFMTNAMGDPTATIDDIAAREAAHRLQPYGTQPTIEKLTVQGQEARLILPSADQPAGMEGQTALIVRYPRAVEISGTRYEFFVLYADQDHVRTIAATIRFELAADATAIPAISWKALPPGLIYRLPTGAWMMIDADEQPVELPTDPSMIVALSPDGRQLLSYGSREKDPPQAELTLADLVDQTSRRLDLPSDRTVCCFHWWPERPGIILFSAVPAEAPRGLGVLGNLAAMPLDGGEYQILDAEHAASPGQFAPGPDGETIAYGGPAAGLYRWGVGSTVFDPAAYGLVTAKGLHLGSPSWSPDGTKLAWVIAGDLGPDGGYGMGIGLFDLQEKTARILHPYVPLGSDAWPQAAQWSPDGKWLAFAAMAQEEDEGGVWVMPVDAPDQELRLGLGIHPIWSPDGRWLAYNRISERQTLVWVAEAGSWEQRPLESLSAVYLLDWGRVIRP